MMSASKADRFVKGLEFTYRLMKAFSASGAPWPPVRVPVALLATSALRPPKLRNSRAGRNAALRVTGAWELGGWETEKMVRRYAHFAAEHLAVYAESNCQHADFQSVFVDPRGLSINYLQRLPRPSPGSPWQNHGTPSLSSAHSWHIYGIGSVALPAFLWRTTM
jgi:hypothetical protein